METKELLELVIKIQGIFKTPLTGSLSLIIYGLPIQREEINEIDFIVIDEENFYAGLLNIRDNKDFVRQDSGYEGDNVVSFKYKEKIKIDFMLNDAFIKSENDAWVTYKGVKKILIADPAIAIIYKMYYAFRQNNPKHLKDMNALMDKIGPDLTDDDLNSLMF